MAKSLSELMADAARELQDQVAPQDTMRTAAQLAVRDIDGCAAAALSIVRRRQEVETLAATSDQARRGDELQYQTGEGPCLSSIWEQTTVSSPELRVDDRWPTWGPRMADEVGYESMLAFQLFTFQDDLGALNLYGDRPHAFSDTDHDHGLALAAHIAVAVRSAQRIENLDDALASRTQIGVAMGMVMERWDLTEERAFELLARLASEHERKVRDIAQEVVANRRLP